MRLRLYCAAVEIQRMIRGKFGRDRWTRLKSELDESASWEEKQKKMAALMIQSAYIARHTRVALQVEKAVQMEGIYQPKPGAHTDRGWNILHFCCYTGSLAGVRITFDSRRALKRGLTLTLTLTLTL